MRSGCKLVAMPELPDISAYITALEARILGLPLERVRLGSVFLLRTAEPPLRVGRRDGRGARAPPHWKAHRHRRRGQFSAPTTRTRRRGPRKTLAGSAPDDCRAFALEGGLWRSWPGGNGLAAFDFPTGSLVLTEAGTKRRASLHVLRRRCGALDAFDPGGVEIFATCLDGFRAALMQENRTLKRALTDPRLISGVGNAYSDEILHAAQLVAHRAHPQTQDRRSGSASSTRRGETLTVWIERLRAEAG